jgi:predicted dehydrogenase
VYHQRVHLFGTLGRLEITIPFNQPQTEPITYLTHDGSSVAGLDATHHEVATNDQYASQAEAFCARIRNEQPTDAPLRDAMTNMSIIDATFRAAQSGRFEPIAR